MNLTHNYHELEGRQRLAYWLRDRWQLSRKDRFFFEGHRALPGQMYLAERRALYDAVVQRRPTYCFEIGTASGGGSTYFIASALAHIGHGKLVSLEADKAASERAAQRYRSDLQHLGAHVEFLAGNSPDAFLPYLEGSASGAECIFLDGADTAQEAVAQYQFFLPFVHKDAILMAHDWDFGKMSLLKPMVETDSGWHLLSELHEPESVGFVTYVRTADAG